MQLKQSEPTGSETQRFIARLTGLRIIWVFVEKLHFTLIGHGYLNIVYAFVLAVLLFGLGTTKNQDYFRISKQPFVTDEGASAYQESILQPLIAHYSGLSKNFEAYIIFCGVVVFLAFCIFYAFPRSRFGKEDAWMSVFTLAMNSATLVAMNWLGMVDGLTILLGGILAFSNSASMIFIAALLGATNHPLMLLVIPGLGILRLAASDDDFDVRKFLLLIFGMGVGLAIVRVFLAMNHILIETNRIDMMFANGVKYWFNKRIFELPASIFSMYSGVWFLLIVYVAYGFSLNKKYYLTFIGIQILSAGIAYFTFDFTRVFGLLTLPGVCHCILTTFRIARKNGELLPARQVFLLLTLINVFLPKFFAWNGRIVFPKIIQLLLAIF